MKRSRTFVTVIKMTVGRVIIPSLFLVAIATSSANAESLKIHDQIKVLIIYSNDEIINNKILHKNK